MVPRLFSKLSFLSHRATARRVHYGSKFPKPDNRVQRLIFSTYIVRKGFASSTSFHCISKLDSFWPSQFSKGKLAWSDLSSPIAHPDLGWEDKSTQFHKDQIVTDEKVFCVFSDKLEHIARVHYHATFGCSWAINGAESFLKIPV